VKPVLVELDAPTGPYRGWWSGETWNGGLVVGFDYEAVRQLAVDTAALVVADPDGEYEVVEVTDREDDFPLVEVVSYPVGQARQAEVVERVAGPDQVALWLVGARAWAWRQFHRQTRGNGRYR
jgi:hypothetical protein